MLFVPSRATLNVSLLHRTPYIQGVLKMVHIFMSRESTLNTKQKILIRIWSLTNIF
jgi:hypothetical protein